MADDAQAQKTQDDKNPLDVLEELLKDSGGGSGAAGATGGGAEKPKEEGELSEAELAQKRLAFEQQKADQAVTDTVDIEKQKALLETIKQSPEYLARVQQEEAAVEQTAQGEEAAVGFDIKQLEHDKI